MVATLNQRGGPFGLVVTGQAESWLPAIEQIVGANVVVPYKVNDDKELLEVVSSGIADAAVLDDEADWCVDVLQMLRMIRRVDSLFPVVVVTERCDRRLLEGALRLTAFSVVAKPLELEEFLRQISRIMARLDEFLWSGGRPPTRPRLCRPREGGAQALVKARQAESSGFD